IAHESVLNTAKVDPGMRKLVCEQWSGVKIFLSVTVFPLVSGSPRYVALLGQWIRRRAQPQDIQQHRLVVAFPTVGEEAAFRLPAVRDRCTLVLRPLPIGAAIERVGEYADFTLVGCTGVEINPRRQRASYQKSTIHCRQFA